MRLIDANKVIEAIEDHKKAVLGEIGYDEGIAYGYAAAHEHIIEMINLLPTVEVEDDKAD